MSAHPDRKRPARSSSPRAATEAFLCAHCGNTVPAEAPGTRQRNHCPHCLHSLHVDLAVGDRRSLCRGLMEPIGAWVRADGELALLHRCQRCGVIRSNRVAGDDDLAALQPAIQDLARRLEEPGAAAG